MTTTLTPRCAPWCASHGVDQHPDDHVCTRRATSPAFGELLLTHTDLDGAMVNLYDVREELTLAEAERLARAILAQIGTALATVPRAVAS